MSLGLNLEAGGAFTPYVKYDARAGRWFRAKNKEKGETLDVDITQGFSAVFDLANLQVGWMAFPKGAAPQYTMQPLSMGLPATKPSDQHKQGCLMTMALPASLGGGVYEVASTAKAYLSAIDELHTAFEAAPEAKAGKLPVVTMTGTEIVETQSANGTTRNYKPKLVIAQWIDRPPTLAPKATTAPAAVSVPNRATPPATGATPMAPPTTSAPDLNFG